ncbi:hypothetical protein CANCADRAFT_56140 [Tortispora caseinolytica NRRL Y-17796]|uniref:Uncharacterized protein n=1 Tax=Tortispora caseinolytica NRRL Y-17796 TaxID=767744 RepID=A0A1E4TL47_9ASCO|nr:hypothetical protein CANCADRAFT_56140 [Tortispora caseinolytica NRRL Y-17796]
MDEDIYDFVSRLRAKARLALERNAQSISHIEEEQEKPFYDSPALKKLGTIISRKAIESPLDEIRRARKHAPEITRGAVGIGATNQNAPVGSSKESTVLRTGVPARADSSKNAEEIDEQHLASSLENKATSLSIAETVSVFNGNRNGNDAIEIKQENNANANELTNTSNPFSEFPEVDVTSTKMRTKLPLYSPPSSSTSNSTATSTSSKKKKRFRKEQRASGVAMAAEEFVKRPKRQRSSDSFAKLKNKTKKSRKKGGNAASPKLRRSSRISHA